MTRTPMARLPWLTRTIVKKKILRGISKKLFLFYQENVCCVHILESPQRGESNEYTQLTFILENIEKISLDYPLLSPGPVL